ncbi:MAG: DegT/DnrJ/EryC1/StrS family aminotransferase [Nitrososphaerales archaeon]
MSKKSIPLVQLDNTVIWEAVLPRLESLIVRGEFTLGPELESFERAAAAAFGCRWAAGTSSGTSALTLALRSLQLKDKSRIALPANTFFATLEAVVLAGHIPVVVDHDDDYLCSIDSLESIRVDALIPVHLHGLPVDMNNLKVLAVDRGWSLIEDCSQAHGATIDGMPVGSFGHLGAFSAYPTKNLGAWGDAGFVTGNDPEIERKVKALRHHGQFHPDIHQEIGGTHRLDNLQALVLEEKLRRMKFEVESRRQIAVWYHEELADTGLALPGDRGQRRHAYHHYVLRVKNRDVLCEHLSSRGIASAVHYPMPVHLQPAAAQLCEVPYHPVRAEASSREVISLPIYPGLSRDDVARIGKAVRDFLA